MCIVEKTSEFPNVESDIRGLLNGFVQPAKMRVPLPRIDQDGVKKVESAGCQPSSADTSTDAEMNRTVVQMVDDAICDFRGDAGHVTSRLHIQRGGIGSV
jgi:hypothetical protein